MEYEVKVKGTEDIHGLEKAINSLGETMRSAKGQGKALEEVRKIITGFKGQAGVFKELRDGIASISPAVDRMENSVKGMGSALTRTLKSELELTRATLRNELGLIAKGMGGKVAQVVSDEVGGGLEKGIKQSTAKGKTAAAKARAEMTAAYESIVGGNGLKQLSKDEIGEVALLKNLGAQVSKFHAVMLQNELTSLQNERKVADEFRKVADKKVADQIAANEKQLAADRTFLTAKLSADQKRIALEQKTQQELASARVRQNVANFESSLGLSKGQAVKSAKDSASVFAEAYALELARSRETILTFERSLGLDNARVANSARESAKVYAAAYAAELTRSRGIVAAANNAPSAVFQRYNPSTGAAGAVVGAEKIAQSSKEMRNFAKEANDAHSAVRGLASGFNLLWLTWGNLGPLLAGAAISNTFMQAAKTGMDVAHTMQIISSLGGAAANEIHGLNQELMRMGRDGTFGPKALSEAMQTMVLAGMKVEDVKNQLKDVVAFSKAGTTSVQTAADVLVSVTTAFGTGAAGMTKSADIIVRAAADSKASVESFGEAMKLASVVGEQFGATQEDVAVLISMLANLGIQGTAAGTAVRNMFADLSGRTAKTAKLMKQAGIDMRDGMTGAMLPSLEMAKQLSDYMDRLAASKGPKAAKDFMQALMSERGNKPMVAMLVELKTAAQDTEKYANAAEEKLARLKDAAGTTAIANAELARTTKSVWQSVGASFQTAMEEVYGSMDSTLYETASALKALATNQDVIDVMKAIGTSVAVLTQALAENAKVIAAVATAWGVWKLSSIAATAASGLLNKAIVSETLAMGSQILTAAGLTTAKGAQTVATNGLTTATVASTVAQEAAAVASVTLGGAIKGLIASLGAIGIAITAATFLWDLYKAAKESAMGGVNTDIKRGNDLIADLNKQADEARKRAAQLNSGASEADVRMRQDAEQRFSQNFSNVIEKEIELKQKLLNIDKAIADNEKKFNNRSGATSAVTQGASYEKQAKNLRAERQGIQLELNSLQNTLAVEQGRVDLAMDNVRKASREEQDAVERKRLQDAQARRQKEIAAGKFPGFSKEELKQYMEGGEFPARLGAGADLTTGAGAKGAKGPSESATYFNSGIETFREMTEAQKNYMQSSFEQGKLSVADFYDYLEATSKHTFEQERIALQERQAAMEAAAKADPKDFRSAKEAAETAVKLGALELKQASDLAKIEKDRAAAEESRISVLGRIHAFGQDYVKQIKENDTGVLSIQRGGDFLAEEQARVQIARDFAKTRVRTEEEYYKSIKGLSEEAKAERRAEFDAALAQNAKYESDALALTMAAERAKRIERTNGINGVQRAVDDYMKTGADMATSMEGLTNNALKGMEDAFVNLAMTGKLSFKSLADSIISDMIRIAARQAMLGLVGNLFSAILPGASSGAAVASSVYTPTAIGTTLPALNAKGGVYDSPSLSSYSNQIHASPKTFAFAKGAALGMFGEAGPEAIMPLTRGSDGNLGVRQVGGRASSGPASIKFVLENRLSESAQISNPQVSQDENGNLMIAAVIERASNVAVNKVATQMATKTGIIGKVMRNTA